MPEEAAAEEEAPEEEAPETSDVMLLDTEVQQIATLSMAQLRAKLREMGLPTGGKREVLAQRYIDQKSKEEE